MSRKEKFLYQENRLGYSLMLLFTVINAVYAIVEINNMKVDNGLGITVLLNIFLSLLTFLTAVKIRRYFTKWALMTFLIGLFQFSRIIFIPIETKDHFFLFKPLLIYWILIGFLSLSGMIALLAALISFIRCSIRTQLLNAKKQTMREG